MKLKTPAFWYRSKNSRAPLIEWLLRPLSYVYALGHDIHQRSKTPEKIPVPVICIGNIVAGGAGKTPAALALMELIHKNTLANAPHFLTRGYGGTERGPLIVERQNAQQVGDESLLLASSAPTVVSSDRAVGGKLAAQSGADLIVMDDGLQNPGIAKDIRLVVIDGYMGFGNGHLLPAGPLRAPLDKNLKSANAFILIGPDTRAVKSILPPRTPVFEATLKPLRMPDVNKNYIAFAGLGYPEKFFRFLKEELKLNVVESIAFPDHHPYTEADIEVLKQKADTAGAQLITTEKDKIRLPADAPVETLPVQLVWNNEADLVDFLKAHLA
jgi:tetraacyldisaccharide 4'-kinase